MSRPTQFTIASALAKNPPFEGEWCIVYYNTARQLTQIGWRRDNVLLMSVFNQRTGLHVRTELFNEENNPPKLLGFEELLERLVTE